MDPVQEQVDALNDRDLERFVSAFSPNVVVTDGAGNVMMEGHDGLRTFYGPAFSQSPQMHVDVLNRTSVGQYVIDEERVTGIAVEGYPPEMHGAAVYKVVDGKIAYMQLLT